MQRGVPLWARQAALIAMSVRGWAAWPKITLISRFRGLVRLVLEPVSLP
jgi:hypothetical protein